MNDVAAKSEKTIYLDEESEEEPRSVINVLRTSLNAFEEYQHSTQFFLFMCLLIIVHYILYFSLGVMSETIKLAFEVANYATIMVNFSIILLIPGTLLFSVAFTWLEQRFWMKLIKNRENLIEGLISGDPIETWMVWRVRKDFWERIGEILEILKMKKLGSEKLSQITEFTMVDLVGKGEFLKKLNWISIEPDFQNSSDDVNKRIYSLLDSGRGFLSSYLEIWNVAFSSKRNRI
ncbi:MAG: hypothetical protein ACTSUV_04475 [Candidatus Ranarchaeia archaeon]